jgi:hypothetical protein
MPTWCCSDTWLGRPAALVFSVLLPAKPLLWLGFQHSTLVSSWRRYFNFSFVVDEKLNQDGRYIFAGLCGCFCMLCIALKQHQTVAGSYDVLGCMSACCRRQ